MTDTPTTGAPGTHLPPLLATFCLLATTATSEAADSAQALEWAALKPASARDNATDADAGVSANGGASATLTLQRFWRGVKLHPDDVPLFRRLELGPEFDSLRRQGKSIHEAFGDLLVFAAGAPLVCVDEITATVLRRMGRGLIRQPLFSLREVAAIALPTLANPTLDALDAALFPAPPAATATPTAPDALNPPPPPPAEILRAAARVEQAYRLWRGLEAKLAGLPLPVLTEINFLPGVGLHPIQGLLSAAEKQAVRRQKLGLDGGADPVGPNSRQNSIEALWQDFSAIIEPRTDSDTHRARGFSLESAAAEQLRAETEQAARARADQPDSPLDDPAVAPVTAAEIREIFQPGGPLSRVFANYEMRAEQVDMAVAVAEALNTGRHLMVEAGTGTGKSLAYLVPAVLFSLRNKTPLVISTHTKTLQAQLMQKDIPVLKKALGAVFQAALLKGRSNYLCLRKFNELLRNAAGHLEPDEYPPMPGVVSWATASNDGDVERCGSIDPARDWRLWTKMHTVGADCLGRKCRYYHRCFVFKARGEARQAHVIVANHALVFASLNREQGALPALRHVIFDEAHGLEDVATDFLSVEFDRLRLIRQLNRFARESQGGGSSRTGGGLIHQLTEGLDKTRAPLTPEVLDQARGRLELAREALLTCSREAAAFEAALGGLFPQSFGGDRGDRSPAHRRGREFVPEPTDPAAAARAAGDSGRERFGAQKLRYSPDRKRDSVWDPIHAARDRLITAIAHVLKPLKLIHDEFELLKAGRFNGAREIEHELKAQLDFLAEIGQDLEFLVRGDNPDYVYWAETTGGARPRLTLQAAPLKIHQMLHEQLWQRCRSAVLTSATLTGEGSFDFLAHRLGLDLLEPARWHTLRLDSSFDYREQCRILVPAHVPPPDQSAFAEQFKALVFDAVTASRGRALVLFTSYVALNEAARVLTAPLGDHGIAVLAQGRDGSREQLLTQLQAGPPCAIFGTSSFWEGIDVPGEALSLLIVAKLPFPAFKDPLWEARRETLEEEGRSAFQHLDIPVAVLKLRQGFGRLIRSRLDRGVFILADTRVLSRRYGWSFLQALPRGHEVVGGSEAVYRTIERFFDSPAHATPATPADGSARPDRGHVEYDDWSAEEPPY